MACWARHAAGLGLDLDGRLGWCQQGDGGCFDCEEEAEGGARGFLAVGAVACVDEEGRCEQPVADLGAQAGSDDGGEGFPFGLGCCSG